MLSAWTEMHQRTAKAKFEASLFFAKRLQLNKQTNNGRSAVSTLNVAITGMILAIVIMVVAVSVVTGFKSTIINKITNLDSHIKIFNKHLDSSDNMKLKVFKIN